jgi:1-deoxy-D-xylulose 5-phosphate reductoisomerase
MASESAMSEVKAELQRLSAPAPREVQGADALVAVATHPDADVVLFASSGTAGLDAVLAAIECGRWHRHGCRATARRFSTAGG